MKKVISVVLSLVCVFALLCGCENKSEKVETATSTETQESVDYATLTNNVMQDTMSALVKINVTFSGGNKTFTYYGSGVVYQEIDGEYYALTNNHVLVEGGYTLKSCSVEDYKGNTFSAKVLKRDNAYDLAVVKFSANKELNVLGFSQNPVIGDKIFSLGYPDSQKNTLSYGKVIGYETIKTNGLEEEINVTFPVIKHSCYTFYGSSGGPVLDLNSNIVGIHYAGRKNNNKFICGFAIPVAKVLEFLENNDLLFDGSLD